MCFVSCSAPTFSSPKFGKVSHNVDAGCEQYHPLMAAGKMPCWTDCPLLFPRFPWMWDGVEEVIAEIDGRGHVVLRKAEVIGLSLADVGFQFGLDTLSIISEPTHDIRRAVPSTITMKAIQIEKLVSGPDELKVSVIPDLQPDPKKYLIKVHATAINFFDNLQVQGKHQQKPPLPFVAGNEFSGEVLATPTSQGNWQYKKGDRVFGAGIGAFAEQFLAAEVDLRPIPKGWSYLEASSLFYTAPTAYAALILRAKAKKGTSPSVGAL